MDTIRLWLLSVRSRRYDEGFWDARLLTDGGYTSLNPPEWIERWQP